jgi:hypothetical protein
MSGVESLWFRMKLSRKRNQSGRAGSIHRDTNWMRKVLWQRIPWDRSIVRKKKDHPCEGEKQKEYEQAYNKRRKTSS